MTEASLQTRRLFMAASAAATASLAAGCTTWRAPAGPLPSSRDEPRDAWARVLERFVDDRGRVDFDGIARDPSDLQRFVAWVDAVGPATEPARFSGKAQVPAYHLNAYNALAMHAVVADGVPASLAGWRKLVFFIVNRVRIDGRAMSLYTYENAVIRPLGEPRIHFALNCMVAGCPRLPREPFDAALLESQLDACTREFVSEPRNVRVDVAERTVFLSEIFAFYTRDYLAVAPSLTAYVNAYRAEPLPLEFKVAFMPYDWTVNRQPGRG